MGDVVWIDSTEGLARLAGGIGQGPVAFDLEADSYHHYRDKICLAQISFDRHDALVDPLAGASLAALGPALADPEVRKVLHGADYDLRLLHRDHGLAVRGLFDTMIAARLLGERAFGLSALLEGLLGVRLDKSLQRADWSQRPLPPAMVAYAIADTRHLLALAARLEERLVALGRGSWAEEEFRRLETVRWVAEAPDPDAWRKVKGASTLDRRGLAVLRELAGWRDRIASARDRPLFRVARDEVLVALAARRPERAEDLRETGGVPRGFHSGEAASELLQAVARGVAVAPPDLPEVRRGERHRISPQIEQRARKLRDGRDLLATELGIEPTLLANRSTLEAIAHNLVAGDDPWTVPELRAWQVELLVPVLRAQGA